MTDDETAGRTHLYFEDLRVGQRFRTGSYTITEAQIKAFATQFDPQPFHLDDTAARATLFGGLVASGWHTAAITMRLLVDGGLSLAGGSVGLGVELDWIEPVRPDDCLHVEGEVIEVTASRSRPDRGRVKMRNETRNQRGVIVQVAINKVLVPRRPAPP
jgi:acyl dehydratase